VADERSALQLACGLPQLSLRVHDNRPVPVSYTHLDVYKRQGSVSVDTVSTPKVEVFYWVTIMFSQTLGTALGDWTADSEGLGYGGGVVFFGALLVVVAALHFWTKISKTVLFWAAFILTRPLGAVVGDLLDKPLSDGGLNLSRYSASAVLLILVFAFILILPQKAGKHPSTEEKAG